MMMWCSHCCENRETTRKPDQEYVCCHCCGKVLVYPVRNSSRVLGKKMNSWIAQYLLSEEEKHLKKLLWEEINREYIEEQAAKAAAAARRSETTSQARLFNGSEESLSALELAAATSATIEKSRKFERKRKHTTENNALKKSLKQKSFSSKINYQVLESLYKGDAKKQLTEPESEVGDDGEKNSVEEEHNESCVAAIENDEDFCIVDGDDGDYHYNNEDDDYYEDGNDGYFGGREGECSYYDEWDE